jgi:uncharacterized phage protein (TIGR01671 family)
MIELEQCPFCNGQTEIVTLSCSSGGTPCYCLRCTKCGGIRRFGTLNPADLCRECELTSKTRELEEENRALKEALTWACNRLHQWSPGDAEGGSGMTREILFRGKVTDIPLYRQDKTKIGTWVYGSYVSYTVPRIFNLEDEYVVYRRTVGQFTGLYDKNGVKIFEGDIVTYPDGDGGYEYCDETINSGVVTWGDESALFYITNNYSAEFPDMWDRVDEMEVIGNIHDNEERLKEEAE